MKALVIALLLLSLAPILPAQEEGDKAKVERLEKRMRLADELEAQGDVDGAVQILGEIFRGTALQQIGAAHEFVECTDSEVGHDATDVLGDTVEEGDDIVRIAPEFRRSLSFWVATPTGQVLRWQTRNMAQPDAIKAAVPKLNSSAPSRAAITMSRPVFSPPSARTMMRERRLFSIRV